MFFSDFGLLMHGILEKYLRGTMKREELATYYLLNFRKSVVGRAPTLNIHNNYFQQGLSYLRNIKPFDIKLDGVEEDIRFDIGGYPFRGFIDFLGVRGDQELIVGDHKSRELKPRSKRGKQTKTDDLLDEYLRQLYLYSIAVLDKYGVPPDTLIFNCFRQQRVIEEPFAVERFDEAQKWALGLIHKIENTNEWRPNIDYYACTHICGRCNQCVYYEMQFGKRD